MMVNSRMVWGAMKAMIPCALGVVLVLGQPAGVAHAANPYDGKSPATLYKPAGGPQYYYRCTDTAEPIAAKYIPSPYGRPEPHGAIQLWRSNRCKTYWARTVFYEPHPGGENFWGDAKLLRYYQDDVDYFTCAGPGGNGRIYQGNTWCWTGMIYAPSTAVTFRGYGYLWYQDSAVVGALTDRTR